MIKKMIIIIHLCSKGNTPNSFIYAASQLSDINFSKRT